MIHTYHSISIRAHAGPGFKACKRQLFDAQHTTYKERKHSKIQTGTALTLRTSQLPVALECGTQGRQNGDAIREFSESAENMITNPMLFKACLRLFSPPRLREKNTTYYSHSIRPRMSLTAKQQDLYSGLPCVLLLFHRVIRYVCRLVWRVLSLCTNIEMCRPLGRLMGSSRGRTLGNDLGIRQGWADVAALSVPAISWCAVAFGGGPIADDTRE